jgi:signal transduction histidine kinase
MGPVSIYSVPPLLNVFCFLTLALLSLIRSSKKRTNILFAVICILGTLLNLDILFAFAGGSPRAALKISRLDHLLLVFLLPVYIQFFHTYLTLRNRRWLEIAAYIYAIGLMSITQTPLYIESMQRHFFGLFARGGPLYPLFGVGGLAVTVYVLVELYRAIRRAPTGIEKNRLQYVLVGFGCMGLLNSLNVFPILGFSVYPPGNLSFVPLIVFAVGLFRHDLLDMGFLIKKSLVYSALTALLTSLYAVMVLGAGRLMGGDDPGGSILIQLLLFLAVAFLFGPVKGRVQKLVDRHLFRRTYDYQKTLKRVSQTIVSRLDTEEIGSEIVRTLADTREVLSCGLSVRESGLPRFAALGTGQTAKAMSIPRTVPENATIVKEMERNRRLLIRSRLPLGRSSESERLEAAMASLEAAMVLPLLSRETLIGFISLGEKLSGALFTPEDIDLLETLAGQAALALENARTHRALEVLNENLETRVSERTRQLMETLAEKEKTQEQLIRSESLAALGQLVAGVAHELNNPLASVTGLIQSTIEDLKRLETRVPLEPELIDDLVFADRELARAKGIVGSLLGLSRQTETYTEAVDVNVVVQDALRVLYNQYKYRNLDITERYGKNLPHIRGNFSNLGQVALNLIKNAVQAVAPGKGRITLTTRFEKKTGQVVFECRDTGPGVPEAIRQDIFKPFFTTKEVGQGTGLGLYISHEIVRKHGGSLSLEKEIPSGACFVVRLSTAGAASPPLPRFSPNIS